MGFKVVLRIGVGDAIKTNHYGSDLVGDEMPSKENLIEAVSQMTAEAYDAYAKEKVKSQKQIEGLVDSINGGECDGT